MKKPCCKKGFTLIELLIVIAIIGILAVALLPTILGAPSKGRDTARIADLQKIEKVLLSQNLNGISYPATGTNSCLNEIALPIEEFGGRIPEDTLKGNKVKGYDNCLNKYVYINNPGNDAKYSFGLLAHLENCYDDKTVQCANAASGTIKPVICTSPIGDDASDNWCYAILVK